MSILQIVRLETVKRGNNANLFNPFTDPITLRLTILFSPTKPIPKPRLQITYRISDFKDNQVRFIKETSTDVKPNGEELYSWIDLGTAHDLGLNWTACQLFAFDGAVQLASYQGAGFTSIDACAVAGPHWFELEKVFEL